MKISDMNIFRQLTESRVTLFFFQNLKILSRASENFQGLPGLIPGPLALSVFLLLPRLVAIHIMDVDLHLKTRK